MQEINKEIEHILLNKTFEVLNQTELKVISKYFENRIEFETAQKTLLNSKLLFENDLKLPVPEFEKNVFENVFKQKKRITKAKQRSMVLSAISTAAILCLVIFISFLYKNKHKKLDLAIFANNDTVKVRNNSFQSDTLTNHFKEITDKQKFKETTHIQKQKAIEIEENEIFLSDYNDITMQLISMDFSSIENNHNQDTINSNNNVIN